MGSSWLTAAALSCFIMVATGCQIPVPITISHDLTLDIDEAVALVDLGQVEPPICLPPSALDDGVSCEPCEGQSAELCLIRGFNEVGEVWPDVDSCRPALPDGCPQVDESADFVTLVHVDERDNEVLQKSKGYIDDIVIDRFALDYEENTTTRGMPTVSLWVGPALAEGQSRDDLRDSLEGLTDEEFQASIAELGFVHFGDLPRQEPGELGTVEMQFDPHGRRELERQLMEKQVTLLARGSERIDTASDPIIPKGRAKLRVILRVTFFFSTGLN